MTYEKAHKFLEVKQRKMTKHRGLYNEIAISINRKAIEAVEKQIPKSVEYYDGNDICPNCSYSFGKRIIRTQIKHWVVPYCKMCGQALDWSDEE